MRRLLLPALAILAACGGKVADTWAPPPDPDATAGVFCGDATCAAPQVCLLTATGPRSCQTMPVGGPGRPACGDLCAFAACDGPEDCPAGSACLLSPDATGLRCAVPTADTCTASQAPSVACHTLADCPRCFAACGAAGTSLPGASDSLEYALCLVKAFP
jgi:hypothetical protein